MTRTWASLLLCAFCWTTTSSAESLDYYLPQGGEYAEGVPRPNEVLGFEVGEWHVRHDLLVRYMEALAASSERVTIEVQGHSYEGRPQPLLTITSPANHERLDEILKRHRGLERRMPGRGDLAKMPVVIFLGYSVHGNEASGANSAPVVAYELAAARSEEVERLLDNAVILLDPCLNPDGLDRFAYWANMHRGRVLVGDGAHREHNEVWPGGRTNHYWFDLNRDWLLLQHPESRARMKTYQRWRPNLSSDHHEMQSNSTFFFQPGVQSRVNPLIPEENQALTARVASFHAEALDELGSLYYTEETFDDFYPGKGSTYPDLTGGLGVLFEQASVRGHLRDTRNGPLSFPFAIRNQVAVSMAFLRAGFEMREDLLRYRAEFHEEGRQAAAGDETQGYVIETGDPGRRSHLESLFAQHGIEARELREPLTARGRTWFPGEALIVPVRQLAYRLVSSFFSTPIRFQDPVFYDVSAWTLPHAFGLDWAELDAKTFSRAELGDAAGNGTLRAAELGVSEGAAAHLFEWHHYYAPRALYRLQKAGVRARVATRPFEAETADGKRRFDFGTIVVPSGGQTVEAAEIEELFEEIAREDGIELFALTSGLTDAGIDLGSPSMPPLEQPRPLLVVGPGVAHYQAGEIWHLLDWRFGVELPLVEARELEDLDLSAYTHVLIVGGFYRQLPRETGLALRRWVQAGGVLVTTQDASAWVEGAVLTEPDAEGDDGANLDGSRGAPDEEADDSPVRRARYADYERDRAEEIIGGSIVSIELDTSHPMAFGYRNRKLASFRDSTRTLTPSSNPYENVAIYSTEPRLAGWISERNRTRLSGTAAILATRLGDGAVIRYADNPAFRAYFLGTNKLYLNSLFFGGILQRTLPPALWEE